MEILYSFFAPRKPEAERLSDLLHKHGLNYTSPGKDDSFFDRIASEMSLMSLPKDWSRRPRIYFILTQINKVDLMDDFILHGHDDTLIPYSGLKALPRSDIRRFNHSDALAFLEWQSVCVSQRLQFEQGQHIRLDDGDILFEELKEPLGNGSQMRTTVDKVTSKATGRVYARKRIKRNKVPKEALKEFERELRALKDVEAHEHLVRVCGTYTDKRYFVLLLHPVAEGTLKAFLLANGPRTPEERIVFCTWFGCMAKVLSFLHDEKQIIHKDIKPENFLLLGGRIILTDFGTAFDFSETGHSMTRTNGDDSITPRYASPEVVRDQEFRRASDIWSLGIVFLEMATVLLRRSLKQMDTHLASHNKKSVRIYENRDAALSWLKELSQSGCSPIDNEPLAWIRDMLEQSHKSRPTAAVLFTTCSTCQSGRFCGKCCSGLDTRESDSDLDSDSDLLSSDSDVPEDKFPIQTARAPEPATNRPKNMPGTFPMDAYFVEYREPLFGETLQPSFAGKPEHFISGSIRYHRSGNAGSVFPSMPKKQHTKTSQNQQMVPPKNRERETRSIISRPYGTSPDARRAWSRPKSGSKKANEVTTSTTSASLTVTDQRLNHFLTSLPSDEHFDDIVEYYDSSESIPAGASIDYLPDLAFPEPLPKVVSPVGYSNHDAGKDSRQRSTRLVKARSQENLRRDEEKASYRAEETMNVCTPPVIRYPSDTDLRRHLVELDSREPGFIKNWKQWSANLTLPDTLHVNHDIQYNSDQQAHHEKPINASPGPYELPTPSNEGQVIGSNVPNNTEQVKSCEERDHEVELPAHETNSGKRHKAVTFSHEDEIHVHESPRSGIDEGTLRPMEVNAPTSGADSGSNQPQSASSNNSSADIPAPLGSFLKQIPETKKHSRRTWESATEVMKRILDDKASAAPTSVISKRTKQALRGGPLLMRHNDAYYGYLPHFVKLGKVAAVRELLAGGCNPGTQRKPRWQPLFLAIKGATDKHNKCLLALVNHGADVTPRSSENGKTYLHYAVSQVPWPGYSNTVYILLKTGANPNAKDSNGATPFLSLLTGAGPLDQEERNALLIFLAPNFETSVDIRDPNLNDNALHLTVRRQDPYALDAVLDAIGSDAQKKVMLSEHNASGFDPLLLVLSTYSFATEELTENSTRMLELLLKHGANPNSRDDTIGDTALHLVIAVHKSTAAMELLLRYEASWTIKNKLRVSASDLLHEKAGHEKADPWYIYAEERWLPGKRETPDV